MESFVGRIAKELRGIEVNERKLREFGFVVGGILVGLTLVALWREHLSMSWRLIGGIGAIMVICGVLYPRSLTSPFRIWMGLAIVLGTIISPLVLGFLFFVVITPIALVRRVFSGSRADKTGSAWVAHRGVWNSDSMERLF